MNLLAPSIKNGFRIDERGLQFPIRQFGRSARSRASRLDPSTSCGPTGSINFRVFRTAGFFLNVSMSRAAR